MWQCENCGYTDEDGSTFEVEVDEDNPDESVRYCPECGSDEVYQVDDAEEDDDDDDAAGNGADEEEGDDDEDWKEGDDAEEDEAEW